MFEKRLFFFGAIFSPHVSRGKLFDRINQAKGRDYSHETVTQICGS